MLGPAAGDRFTVQVSQLQPKIDDRGDRQRYSIQFTVQGAVGSNWIRGGTSGPMQVEAQALSQPINAGQYEFFIFIDRVDVDYVYLSVARRSTEFPINWSVIPFGVLDIKSKESPPILSDAPGVQ